MRKPIDERFGDYLDAIATNNRAAMCEAVACIWSQIDHDKEKPPRFLSLLHQMEEQLDRMTTQSERDECRAVWLSSIADKHARDFYNGWIRHMPERWRVLMSEDTVAECFRRAMEEAMGETRQGPANPPTVDEARQELMQRIRRDS